MDIPALPFCKTILTAQRPRNRAYPRVLATLGDHLRKRRLDLGLLQGEVADLIGVKTDTIRNWEHNRSTPQRRHFSQIIAYLGYDPSTHVLEGMGEKDLQ